MSHILGSCIVVANGFSLTFHLYVCKLLWSVYQFPFSLNVEKSPVLSSNIKYNPPFNNLNTHNPKIRPFTPKQFRQNHYFKLPMAL